MHKSEKPSRKCAEASMKAKSTLGMIKRTIVTRYKDTILRSQKSLVRPQMEYCIQVWNPYLKQDRRSWRKCKEELQNDLGIQGFESWGEDENLWINSRKSRGDLIEAYEIITVKEEKQR